jgi:mannan endo-1,4-beta-mannosidase
LLINEFYSYYFFNLRTKLISNVHFNVKNVYICFSVFLNNWKFMAIKFYPKCFYKFFSINLLLLSLVAQGQTTLNPVADTDTQSDVQAGTNEEINFSEWNHIFMKFDLINISGTVTDAKLRLYQPNAGGTYKLNISSALPESWVEGGSKPSKNTLIKTQSISGNSGYIEVDVTAYIDSVVKNSKIASMHLAKPTGGWTTIKSRQSATNKPELIITTTGASNQYSLTTTASHGSMIPNPVANNYLANSLVTLTAVPDVGYVFNGWSGDASGTVNPLTVNMNTNKSITALFSPIGSGGNNNLSENLIDPNAIQATKDLWNYFKSIYGKKMLTGCWTEQQYGGHAKVLECTGEMPAIWGQDMNSWYFSRTNPIWNQVWQDNIAGFKNAHRRGQIIQVNWHWAMVSSKDNNGNYTRDAWGRDINGANMLEMSVQQWNDIVTPGTALYNSMIEDLDYHIVNFLKKIVDDNNQPIPMIFRPLHEIDGGWFWWTCKHDPTKTAQLFRILQDRIMNHHQMHNLIWVYNTGVLVNGGSWPPYQDNTLENGRRSGYYCGDNYCDIIGIDLYDFDPVNRGTYVNQGKTYRDVWNAMNRITNTKMIALCEAEGIPNAEKCFTDPNYAPWLYCLPWFANSYHDNVSNTSIPLCNWNNTQFNSPYVINASDIVLNTSDEKISDINTAPYPNPVKDILHTNGKTEIYDALGILIMEGENQIDVSSLKAGIYIVNENHKITRIVKE